MKSVPHPPGRGWGGDPQMGGRTAQRFSHGGEGAEPHVRLASQRGPDVFCIKLAYLFP